MTLFRRVFAVAAILVSLVGLVINFYLIVLPSDRGPVGAVIYFWSFFTHVTNTWLVLCYVSELTGWRWLSWLRHSVGRASMAASITLVMFFYHFMLAPNYHFTGGLLVSNILMHYVSPVLYLAWWAISSHGTLKFRDIPLMLAPGLTYVAYALIRGAIVSEYPYDILDVAKAGYGRVAIGVGVLLVLVTIFCVVLVAIDRLIGRRVEAPAATAS
jgi:hypothetical protein